jgi:uncharacterized membrane protein YfcA
LDYVVVCLVALLASGLTLFSGFGLGTLLLPAFALFFPVEVAVSATAVVHLLNNLFKLALVGRHARPRPLLGFGLPALGGAVLGAWALFALSGLPSLARYSLGGRVLEVSPVKLSVAALILVFALLELSPAAGRPSFAAKWLPLGGALSGFFGGLSGHQGALRSAFLLQAGLSKEQFIGTGVACAVLVDVARITVYGTTFLSDPFAALGRGGVYGPVIAATLAAFAGAVIGVRLLGKVTLEGVRRTVGVLLILLAVGLGSGLV